MATAAAAAELRRQAIVQHGGSVVDKKIEVSVAFEIQRFADVACRGNMRGNTRKVDAVGGWVVDAGILSGRPL